MSKVSREKIALLVFVGLIAVSICGLMGYLAVGHSWNVAASNIDDAAGRMDGYTAIVYPGTVDPLEKALDSPSSSSAKAKASGKVSGPSDRGTDADDAVAGVAPDAETDAGQRTDIEPSGAGAEDAAPSPSPSTGEAAVPIEPVDLAEIEQSYREKNATVFLLDTEDLGAYREGTILKKGDHRFGVFSVAPTMTVRMIERQVAYFTEHAVDFIVVLTPDKELVEEVSGLDIVISAQDEGLFSMGETINGTFYVNSPMIGSAGVILISPHNVVSAKVMQSL